MKTLAYLFKGKKSESARDSKILTHEPKSKSALLRTLALFLGIAACSSNAPSSSGMNGNMVDRTEMSDSGSSQLDAPINDRSINDRFTPTNDAPLEDGISSFDRTPVDRIPPPNFPDGSNMWRLPYQYCHDIVTVGSLNSYDVLPASIDQNNFTLGRSDFNDMELHLGTCSTATSQSRLALSQEVFAPNQRLGPNGEYLFWFSQLSGPGAFDGGISDNVNYFALYHGNPMPIWRIDQRTAFGLAGIYTYKFFLDVCDSPSGVPPTNGCALPQISPTFCASGSSSPPITCSAGNLSIFYCAGLNLTDGPPYSGRIFQAMLYGRNGSSMIFGLADGSRICANCSPPNSIFVTGNSVQSNDGNNTVVVGGLQRPQNTWHIVTIEFVNDPSTPQGYSAVVSDSNGGRAVVNSTLPNINSYGLAPFISEAPNSPGQLDVLWIRGMRSNTVRVYVSPERTRQ